MEDSAEEIGHPAPLFSFHPERRSSTMTAPGAAVTTRSLGNDAGHAGTLVRQRLRLTFHGKQRRSGMAKRQAIKGRKGYVAPEESGQKGISFHPGGLHESLGVPQGQKIPASTRAAARSGKYGTKAERQELFAENVLKGRKK